MQVKFAKPEDALQLVNFGYKIYEENNLKDLNILDNFDLALNFMTKSVIEDVALVQRNKDNNKLIDGALVLNHSSIWFSKEHILTPSLFYIKPEHRSFKLARDLLCSAKEYAIINRIPIVFDLFAQKDVEKKKKLLKYLGFQDFGSSFVFKV